VCGWQSISSKFKSGNDLSATEVGDDRCVTSSRQASSNILTIRTHGSVRKGDERARGLESLAWRRVSCYSMLQVPQYGTPAPALW